MTKLPSGMPTLPDLQDQLDTMSRDTGTLAALTIVKYGELDVTLDGSQLNDTGGQSFAIPHGLGYAPLFQMYGYDSANQTLFAIPVLTTSGAGPVTTSLPFDTDLKAYADSQSIYAVWHGHAQTPQQQFYYVIYSNPIVTN